MTRPGQKSSETRAIELFLRQCASPPQGVLSVPDDDGKEPDFVFETASGYRTGLEVRKLYKGGDEDSGSKLLRRDGIRRAILQRSHQLFQTEHDEPIDLFVVWRESANSPPVRETAEQLAEFIGGRVPSVGVRFHPDWLELYSAGLSKYISTVRIWHAPQESFALPWHVNSVSGWSGIAFDTVQSAILEKRTNLKTDYSECCDRVWLLLHVPFELSEAYMVGDVGDAVCPVGEPGSHTTGLEGFTRLEKPVSLENVRNRESDICSIRDQLEDQTKGNLHPRCQEA